MRKTLTVIVIIAVVAVISSAVANYLAENDVDVKGVGIDNVYFSVKVCEKETSFGGWYGCPPGYDFSLPEGCNRVEIVNTNPRRFFLDITNEDTYKYMTVKYQSGLPGDNYVVKCKLIANPDSVVAECKLRIHRS